MQISLNSSTTATGSSHSWLVPDAVDRVICASDDGWRSHSKHVIALVNERKNNLMSLAILFHLFCAQHVSDINISIFRSLRLCWWITTSVVLFSVRCVLELLLRLVFGGVRFAGWRLLQAEACFSLQNEHHQIPAATKAPTHNEMRTRRQMWQFINTVASSWRWIY
jgi:hypothetical protein